MVYTEEAAYSGNGTQKVAGGSVLASSGTNDPRMLWTQKAERCSGAQYVGVKHSDDDLVKLFKQKLAARGARGIFGMQRVFKVMDDDNSGTLDIQEFWKALCDFRIQIS